MSSFFKLSFFSLIIKEWVRYDNSVTSITVEIFSFVYQFIKRVYRSKDHFNDEILILLELKINFVFLRDT